MSRRDRGLEVQRAHWNSRANTRDTEFAEAFLRNGARMHRGLLALCELDFPSHLELPDDRPVLFASNHRSLLDIAVSAALFSDFQLTCRFQVHARMFTRPVLGPWLVRLGCIPTSSDTRQEAEDAAVATLLAGQTVAVMPEGRLVRAGERPDGVGPFRTGFSRIVERTGAATVPVGCTGSSEVWPPGRPLPLPGVRRRHTVRVRFGEPIVFTGDDHQANAEVLRARVIELLHPVA